MITYNPLVTIITPILNRITYLGKCIQSVLSQSYPYIEHIFVDGGSTDGTLDILTSYSGRYPDRIRFISEPDKGSGDAWNKGLRMAKGEIFGFLGSDDISEPDAIMRVVEFFRLNPDAYFVFGACNYINERDEIIGKPQIKDFDLTEIINEGCYVPTPSSFYRREVIEKIGCYDAKGNDLDFLIRAGKVFQIYRINEVFSNFRIHGGSATSGSSKEIRKMWLREDCLVSRRHGGRFFSGYCKRYYMYVIMVLLRTVLGAVYPFIRKNVKKLLLS
jgi:glycosyltransferase involved in cell wall biosynthesis